MSSCPVPHSSSGSPYSSSSSGSGDCPQTGTLESTETQIPNERQLSQERDKSSIKRPDNSEWLYPSEQQFYEAMKRKNKNITGGNNVQEIVKIHNTVNEKV